MSTTRRSGSSRWSCSQPVSTRGSRVSTVLLLSEEVVFAGEGLGLLAGAVPVVLGEAALYDLALEKVFDGLDPTPRRTAEDAHEVVSVERALQPLDGVLGPHLVHPPAEASPGLHGDLSSPGGAAGYVRAGELEEQVDVSQHPAAALEVGIPDEAPDGRVAPRVAPDRVAHRPHVVADEVGDGVDVVLGVGQALHRPPRDGGPHVLVAVEVDLPGDGAPAADLALALVCRLLRALRAAVGAAVLVEERAGLADVVEEGRLAQDGEAPLVQVRVGLDAGNHDQGVLEDVLVVELGLLLDLHRLHELRHDEGHVGPRQGSLEADGPQHAQRVVAHPVERLPHRPDHAVLEVLAAPEGVDDVAGEGVGRYGVYGEVAPGQVFFEALPETDLGVAAPLRVQVAAVRRDLDLEAVDLRPYRPESLPDVPEVPRVRPEQAFDLLGPRPRRGVRVQPGHPEQFVAHVPAYQVQLVPRVPERLAEAPDGLGDLQSFYVGHHSQTILVRMGARITDADVLGRPGHPSGGDGGLAGLEDLEEVAEAGNGEDAVDGIGGGGQA